MTQTNDVDNPLRRSSFSEALPPSISSPRSYPPSPSALAGKTQRKLRKVKGVIRIDRDYSEGEICQFYPGWIAELEETRITPTEFQRIMNSLNLVLARANDPYSNCFDNCLAILTLYLSPRIIGSHYIREMAKFDEIVKRVNVETFNPAGLHLLHPRRNGFLFLEIEIF